ESSDSCSKVMDMRSISSRRSRNVLRTIRSSHHISHHFVILSSNFLYASIAASWTTFTGALCSRAARATSSYSGADVVIVPFRLPNLTRMGPNCVSTVSHSRSRQSLFMVWKRMPRVLVSWNTTSDIVSVVSGAHITDNNVAG